MNVTFIFLQLVEGVVQEFCVKPLRLVTHEEGQLRIAKEKLKNNIYETLHIDTTTGFVNKLDGSNISYSAACLRGKMFYKSSFSKF